VEKVALLQHLLPSFNSLFFSDRIGDSRNGQSIVMIILICTEKNETSFHSNLKHPKVRGEQFLFSTVGPSQKEKGTLQK
jgi:hypothetical protein